MGKKEVSSPQFNQQSKNRDYRICKGLKGKSGSNKAHFHQQSLKILVLYPVIAKLCVEWRMQ